MSAKTKGMSPEAIAAAEAEADELYALMRPGFEAQFPPTVNLEAGAGHWSDPKTFEENPVEAGAGDLVERIVPPQTQRDLADVQRFIGNARCELNVPTFQARYGWRLIDAVAEQAAQLAAVTAERDEALDTLSEYIEGTARLDAAHNALINEVWDILIRDETREGGQNLVQRVRELDDHATSVTAENARLREALKWFVDRSQPIQAKFALHGPKDTADAMVDAFRAARAALSQEAPK